MSIIHAVAVGLQLVQQGFAPPKTPWSDFTTFSVVAPLDEPAPKPETVTEVARWANVPGVKPITGDLYRLFVDRAKNGVLVSTRIPEVKRLALLADALRAMPKCPPGLGGTFGQYGPALAAEAGAVIFDYLPAHAPADGKVPPTTRFRLTPHRVVTVESGGKSFEIRMADESDRKLEPDERAKFNRWLQEGRLNLQSRGNDLARVVQADMDRYGKVNARDGVRTMVLQKPYERTVSDAVMDATKGYVEFLKTLRKEAEAEWEPLRADVQKRFPELDGYRVGAGWNDLSPHEQDNLRVGLGLTAEKGLIPGGLDAFLSGLTISSSRLAFGLGVPFEGTRGSWYVPLSP